MSISIAFKGNFLIFSQQWIQVTLTVTERSQFDAAVGTRKFTNEVTKLKYSDIIILQHPDLMFGVDLVLWVGSARGPLLG